MENTEKIPNNYQLKAFYDYAMGEIRKTYSNWEEANSMKKDSKTSVLVKKVCNFFKPKAISGCY
ncbi:MAG: hypothetical protein PHH54_06875 [Candidatus Nanoarchaeia archaeon]|nr:hypothetical protein [Candidatus Nanoarchaeia archaeon]